MHESGKKHPTIRTLQQQRTEKTKNGNRTSQLYNRHTTQHNTLTRVLYNRHTSNTNTQHHHAHITTTKDIPHEGVNRSQTQFKKRVERFSDRPSDRVDSTYTYTQPQSPMTKRLSPNPSTLLARHTLFLEEEEPELPGSIVIDARRHKKERLTPVHFLKYRRNPAHIKRKLSWWDLAIDTHASKTRLSRRWTYILNRRQHRQPAEPQQPWHRHTSQVRTKRDEYLGTPGDTGGLLVGRDPRLHYPSPHPPSRYHPGTAKQYPIRDDSPTQQHSGTSKNNTGKTFQHERQQFLHNSK